MLRNLKIFKKILKTSKLCFSEKKPIKYKDILDLDIQKTEIHKLNTEEYLEDEEGVMNLEKKLSDEDYLKNLGVNIPQRERRSSYYSLIKDSKIYHVFNAEMMVI